MFSLGLYHRADKRDARNRLRSRVKGDQGPPDLALHQLILARTIEACIRAPDKDSVKVSLQNLLPCLCWDRIWLTRANGHR